MTGMEMAAVLMLSLSEDDAAKYSGIWDPKQVQRLGMSMASMKDFNQERVTAMHRQY